LYTAQKKQQSLRRSATQTNLHYLLLTGRGQLSLVTFDLPIACCVSSQRLTGLKIETLLFA